MDATLPSEKTVVERMALCQQLPVSVQLTAGSKTLTTEHLLTLVPPSRISAEIVGLFTERMVNRANCRTALRYAIGPSNEELGILPDKVDLGSVAVQAVKEIHSKLQGGTRFIFTHTYVEGPTPCSSLCIVDRIKKIITYIDSENIPQTTTRRIKLQKHMEWIDETIYTMRQIKPTIRQDPAMMTCMYLWHCVSTPEDNVYSTLFAYDTAKIYSYRMLVAKHILAHRWSIPHDRSSDDIAWEEMGVPICTQTISRDYSTLIWNIINDKKEISVPDNLCTTMSKRLLRDIVPEAHLRSFHLTGIMGLGGMYGITIAGVYTPLKSDTLVPIVFKLLYVGTDKEIDLSRERDPHHKVIRKSSEESIRKEISVASSLHSTLSKIATSGTNVGVRYRNIFVSIDVPKPISKVAVYKKREVLLWRESLTVRSDVDFAGFLMTMVKHWRGDDRIANVNVICNKLTAAKDSSYTLAVQLYGILPVIIGYLQEKGYAHGDLHPDNIRPKIGKNDEILEVSILDFGRTLPLVKIKNEVDRCIVQITDYISPIYGITKIFQDRRNKIRRDRPQDEIKDKLLNLMSKVIAAYIISAAPAVDRLLSYALHDLYLKFNPNVVHYLRLVDLCFYTLISSLNIKDASVSKLFLRKDRLYKSGPFHTLQDSSGEGNFAKMVQQIIHNKVIRLPNSEYISTLTFADTFPSIDL